MHAGAVHMVTGVVREVAECENVQKLCFSHKS